MGKNLAHGFLAVVTFALCWAPVYVAAHLAGGSWSALFQALA